MAKAKRTPAPVKSSAASDKASKVPAKAARASIAPADRQHTGVKAAVPRGRRFRLQSVEHSVALARD